MLPDLCASYGRNLLLVTGRSTLVRSGLERELVCELERTGLQVTRVFVDREPSPDLIDRTVERCRDRVIDVVAAIGGGSVLDAGKALSAMLLQNQPVERFIEGQKGVMPHNGRKVPFIAVPTTSGTGSEVTNNAVISRVGAGGYKRSLRHEAFVPDVALIDPALMCPAPPELTASSGMDACTQLLEAYLSPYGSPYTDTIALSGLDRFARSFMPACGSGARDLSVRGDMAYAALMSGIALVNAGLGIVHGFASSVGGLFDIPHGTLCATLLAAATRENIGRLRELDASHPALAKFARAGNILCGTGAESVDAGCEMLMDRLYAWQEELRFPRLASFGVGEGDFDAIVPATRAKGNPVRLEPESMHRILQERL